MEVDIDHRNDLGISATGCSTFNTENRTKRGFSQGHGCIFTDLIESVTKSDGYRGLSFTCRGRADGCHQDQVAFSYGIFIDQGQMQLGFILTVIFQVMVWYTQFGSNLLNVPDGCGLRDLEI